ncbi:conserved hypothetical protein [Rubrivivax sp. A210]|uniref:hypothetical protein n=1 Tax=Rubrivivax sp. A210 TaxID=2772301 RepID=UPI00199EC86A|nr:hypothetical protein [Rubrivivax sp. A210]CAD5372973.1 conserved hypothetical protein [Rubrivivax sp. A210]
MNRSLPPAPRNGAPPGAASGRRRLLGLGTLSALCALGLRPALALEGPAGAVVLSITGRVRKPNRGGQADFDMPMLEALPQTSFSTRTPWFAQARRFTGPLLRDVLAAAGAQGTTLRLTALNDYRVELPYADPQQHDVIVARLLDDRPMAVRDKGPLFVIYPFDARTELRSAIYYSRSAWQLRTIEVL